MPEHDNHGLQHDAAFDHLLQSALNTYADLGSDSDIAQRVLTHVAAECAPKQSRRWLPWAIALPFAACFIVLALVTASKPTRSISDRTTQARVTQPNSTAIKRDEPASIFTSASVEHGNSSRGMSHPNHAATHEKARRLPKLDVFPTSQPLTQAEQELVAYIAHAPESELQSLVEARKEIDAPLSIAAIEIQPLRTPEPAGN
jgi:hypothetical protein